MIEITVNDMTCGHCVSVITKALVSVEPRAKVEVDLNTRLVRIDTEAEAEEFVEAIREAGYTPVAHG